MESSTMNESIVSSEYVLFLGAGASAPLGCLPTGPFLDHLQTKLNELINAEQAKPLPSGWEGPLHALFQKAARHYQVSQPDSEAVLEYLDFLIETHRMLSLLPKEFSQVAGTGDATKFHREWVIAWSRLRDKIHRIIVEHYSRVDGSWALEIYKSLFNELGSNNATVPIFTTNYDWTFEHLADQAEARRHYTLVDGFKSSPTGHWWNREEFDNFSPDSDKLGLALFKLHGSTSWYRREDGAMSIEKVLTHELPGANVVLIYPTQVKSDAIKVEPFRTSYDYLRQTLMRARLCIVIGFSFRDPAVNEAFRDGLGRNDNLKLAIVEPNMNISPGVKFEELIGRLSVGKDDWESKIRVIKSKFGKDNFVNEELSVTVGQLYDWDNLASWVDPPRRRR